MGGWRLLALGPAFGEAVGRRRQHRISRINVPALAAVLSTVGCVSVRRGSERPCGLGDVPVRAVFGGYALGKDVEDYELSVETNVRPVYRPRQGAPGQGVPEAVAVPLRTPDGNGVP